MFMTKTILTVDDDAQIRRIYTRMFSGSDYVIVQAADGAEALDKVREHPDLSLVVSDCDMPTMDGPEMTTRLRADEHYHDLPIILTSGRNNWDRAEKAGATAYLSKPLDARELRVLVEHCLKIGSHQKLLETSLPLDHLVIMPL